MITCAPFTPKRLTLPKPLILKHELNQGLLEVMGGRVDRVTTEKLTRRGIRRAGLAAVGDAEEGAGMDSDFTYAAMSQICVGPKTNCHDGMPFGRPCAIDS